MLNIIPRQKDSYRILRHGKDVFHKALSAVVGQGEKRFHVKNPEGEDYDLVYVENNSLIPDIPIVRGKTVLPPFLLYDETDASKLYLKVFDSFDAVIFEALNEYTVVLGRIILEHTSLDVIYRDERILWFIPKNGRLRIMEKLPDKKDANALLCCEALCSGYNEGLSDQMSAEFLFLNVFVFQWLTDLPLDRVRYVEVTISYIAGIGAILSWMTRVDNAFSSLGCKTFLQPESSRYGELTGKYFHVEAPPEDSDESNTIYIANFSPLATTHFLNSFSPDFHASVLRDSFRAEMDDYYDAVIGGRKTLGILMRGTDYITTGLTGTRQHATVDDMLPMIRQWMAEDQYACIFLATEDQDILERMRAEFGSTIRAIAQERHRVSDFKEGQTISQLEVQERSGKDYMAALEDTTVNYFYALYLLSRCDSFMASGLCNGWDVVNAFNDGKFKRVYKFQVGLKPVPGCANRIGSGKMLLYGDHAYEAISLRATLKEAVNPDLLQQAVDYAVARHPWTCYGMKERANELFYNDELTRRIEVRAITGDRMPRLGDAECGMHLTGVFYQGNVLSFSTFHGLTDGRGLLNFANDALDAYALRLAGEALPDPSQPLPTDMDAEPFDAVDDALKAAGLADAPIPESDLGKRDVFMVQDKLLPHADGQARHMLIRVDARDMMGFVKKEGVTPVSALAALYAAAVLKVHSDSDRKLKIAVPVDFRLVLGIPGTHRNCAMPPVIFDVEDVQGVDVHALTAKIGGAVQERTSTAAKLLAVKAFKALSARIPAMPYADMERLLSAASSPDAPAFTFNCSYAARYRNERFLSIVDSMYVLSPAYGAGNILAVTATPEYFFISLNQNGATTAYLDAFMEALSLNGIRAGIDQTLCGNGIYVALRESLGLK